jgi:predicted nucleic acid-binding protein
MRVVDASVLCDFLLGRDAAIEALLGDHALEHEPLHAPELIEPEVLNALRRLVRRGALSVDRAEDAVTDLGDVRLVRYPHASLRRRVWGLRDRLSAYDATYLALAEGLDGSTLFTGDRGLAEFAGDVIGARRVRHVP